MIVYNMILQNHYPLVCSLGVCLGAFSENIFRCSCSAKGGGAGAAGVFSMKSFFVGILLLSVAAVVGNINTRKTTN